MSHGVGPERHQGVRRERVVGPNDGSSEATLSDGPGAGVGEAFLTEDDFVVLYPSLHRYASATADSDMDPADLVQEALVRYLRSARQRRIDQPLAYLRQTILNLVISHRRSAARQSRSTADRGSDDARSDSYPSDSDSILERLSPVDRALLALTVLDGLSASDAATAVGVTPIAARARLSRAKRSLRTKGLT
jgi:RNA polymerase sigma-70 factor (ECF subfamily)